MTSSDEITKLVDEIYKSKSFKMEEFISQIHDRITTNTCEMIPSLETFSEVILRCEMDSFPSNTVKNIIEFIIDQSYEHTEFPMFNALEKMVKQKDFPAESALRIASYVFECNDLQEHQDKTTRLAAIRTVQKLMNKGDKAFRDQGTRWINGYVKATTGERNPEVLLENFKLAKIMIRLLDVHKNEALMDELFNALCVYFPIRFSGSNESDKILGKQLDEALREALIASPKFGSLLGVFLIEKLQDDEDTYKDKVDLCILLEDYVREYPMDDIGPFIQGILDGLRTTSMDPRHKGEIDEICHAVRKLLEPLMRANRFVEGVYEKVAKHNFDNTEPFLVRPEMGFLEKAVNFLTPWAENEAEINFKGFVRPKVLEILFNNIHSASLIDYAQESLEIISKWLDIAKDTAEKMLSITKEAKERAFYRISHGFPSLLLTHMHILLKIKYIENDDITADEIKEYIEPAFSSQNQTTTIRNSCISLVQNLPPIVKSHLPKALVDILEKVPDTTFASQLACSAIRNEIDFNNLHEIAFAGFSEETCTIIMNYFVEARRMNSNEYNEHAISQKIIHWLLTNFNLKLNERLFGHREKIIELAKILFEIVGETDISNLLKKDMDLEGFPYLALLAIKASASGKLNTPIAHWHKIWSPFYPNLELSLRYASLVQGETDLQSVELIDVVSLKKRSLEETPLDYHLVIKVIEKWSAKLFSFDVLFDFQSVWYNHKLLGLKMPKSFDGMDYRERYLIQIFYPLLKYVEQHMERLTEFAGMFEPAIKLLESIPSFQNDKEIFYSMTLDLVMTSLAKEGNLSMESTKLMTLLPNLFKHAPKHTNAQGMVETVLKIIQLNPDLASTLIAMTTLSGLVDTSPLILADPTLRRKLYFTVDRQTISTNRKIREIASKMKRKLSKAA